MEVRIYKDFPYEIRDLEQNNKEKLLKSFNSTYDYIRIGPKGYVLFKKYETEAASIYNMKIRPTDVIVASYQRSGTTWLQELVWMVLNDVDFERSNAVPLVERYSFLDQFMYINDSANEYFLRSNGNTPEIRYMLDEFFNTPAHKKIENVPGPRFIKTHLPMSLMPRQALDIGKVVYVARDPRDVAVSSYFHAKLFNHTYDYKGDFKQFWNYFYNDLYTLTPFFEHVKEAWTLRSHPNMLFVFYEEMLKDLPATIKKVSNFFGKHLTEQQSSELCEHLRIENFKKNKSVNFETLKSLNILSPEESFIRKGKAGGWKDYFDEEMTKQAEEWIENNLKDTDLRFPNTNN
ncbi:hypothetical protein K1T71_004103 [Dendrolimus kikuchii]|uniref:Uncharacterized protein n=1 Tax=Dendrolimus kikuchii TaxID=765133 RepID=A0ACC1DAA2_9NEOP|nr:hypothetical protein K1T71_004103 [Dendrolimus kikuchii]